jgi:pyruvate ferredoxin oxidoreductase beta subunit/2-oxoisovalerate ferredoxin oxidoreductase beta subunit
MVGDIKNRRDFDSCFMTPGHMACPGCGGPLALSWVLEVLGKKTVIGLPACCFSIITGAFPHMPLGVNLVHTAFETAAALATGMKAGLEVTGRGDVTVLAWAGDGGTFDIGLQALSGACERAEDIFYICYDNEAYMNTGNQRSSATPVGSWTTTTPTGEASEKKDIMAIVAAHRIPYAATASVAFPEDLKAKVKKGMDIRGTKFIHIHLPCPTGWQMASDLTIKAARLAVNARVFPLFEIFDGEKKVVNYVPKERIEVSKYLEIQGRFSRLNESDIEDIQRGVDSRWEKFLSGADEVSVESIR